MAECYQEGKKDCKVTFDVLDDREASPVGHKLINSHLHFDVKLDLRRKVRYVVEDFRSNPPTALTYASVVGRDSV